MKTCPNCGHQMPEDAKYCDACGAMFPAEEPAPAAEQEPSSVQESAPVQEPVPAAEATGSVQVPTAPQPPEEMAPTTPPPPARGGSKKPLVIGVAAVAVAAVGVGAFLLMNHGGGSKLPADPAGQFIAIQTGYMDSMFTALDKLPVNTTPEKVSTDLTLLAQYDDDGEISSYLEGSSIGIQVDATQNSTLFGMDFTFKNTPIASGTLTYEDGIFGLCVPELADSWYTLDLARFLERYSSEPLVDLSQMVSPSSTLTSDDLHTLLKDYLGILLSAVTDENILREENASFTVQLTGRERTGTRYTVTPTVKDLEGMLLVLAEHLKEDELLRSFQSLSYSTSSNLFTYYSGDASLEEELSQAIQAFQENAAQIAQTMVDEHFTWILCTDGKSAGRQTISSDSFNVTWEWDDKDFGLTLSAYDETAVEFTCSPEAFYLLIDDGWDSITAAGDFSEQGGLYSGNVSISANTDFYLDVTYQDVSPKKTSALGAFYGSYAISVHDGYSDLSIQLDIQAGEEAGSDHILTFSTDLVDEAFDPNRLTLTLHSSDTPSTISKPTSPQVDVTDYTEEDFDALINEMSDAATALLFKLMMALYS